MELTKAYRDITKLRIPPSFEDMGRVEETFYGVSRFQMLRHKATEGSIQVYVNGIEKVVGEFLVIQEEPCTFIHFTQHIPGNRDLVNIVYHGYRNPEKPVPLHLQRTVEEHGTSSQIYRY